MRLARDHGGAWDKAADLEPRTQPLASCAGSGEFAGAVGFRPSDTGAWDKSSDARLPIRRKVSVPLSPEASLSLSAGEPVRMTLVLEGLEHGRPELSVVTETAVTRQSELSASVI
jgi:hypothetical protein